MTIIAWDGETLATDSKVSKADLDGHYVEGRKIWVFDQPVLFKRKRGGDLRFLAAALTGSGRFGVPIIEGITNYCRDGTKTLNNYREDWARLGAHWPESGVAQVLLVGADADGVPVCYRMVRSQENPLVSEAPGTCFGSGSTNLGLFTTMGLSAVEMVELGILAQPKWCGGTIQTYHVPSGTLGSLASGQVDLLELKTKAQTMAVGAVNQFFAMADGTQQKIKCFMPAK